MTVLCRFSSFVTEKLLAEITSFCESTKNKSDGEILASFLQQFYNGTPFIPKEIHLPVELPDQKILEEWLSYVKGKKVYILVPKQGDKEKLVELAGKNAGILMLRYVEKYRMEEKKRKEALEELKNAVASGYS